MFVLKKKLNFQRFENLNLNSKCATIWWKRCTKVNAKNWRTSGKIVRFEWMIFLSYGIKKLTKKHGIFNHSELKFLKKCKSHSDFTSNNLAKLGRWTQVFLCSTSVALVCRELVTDTYSVTQRRCKLKAAFCRKKTKIEVASLHMNFKLTTIEDLSQFRQREKRKVYFWRFGIGKRNTGTQGPRWQQI